MKKNKISYYVINLIFIICAIFFINFTIFQDSVFSLPKTLIILGLFILTHFIRFIRMYFILLEDLINPNRFLQLYLKTTFVSTLIPYKIGEIFKMYCYGVETNSYSKGIIAVLIEKFFDAIILCAFMIPHAVQNTSPNPLLIIMLVFIFMTITVYCSFERTYGYLNQFLIRRGGGNKSLTILKILEAAKNAFDNTKRTLRGRATILLLLSLFAWIIETILVVFMNSDSGIDFNSIYAYINDAFLGINNVFFNYYISLCTIIFPTIIAIIYGKKYFIILKNRERSKHV